MIIHLFKGRVHIFAMTFSFLFLHSSCVHLTQLNLKVDFALPPKAGVIWIHHSSLTQLEPTTRCLMRNWLLYTHINETPGKHMQQVVLL